MNHLQESNEALRAQQLKERADDPFWAAQVTKEEIADVINLPRGDFVKKYGSWQRFYYVRGVASSMSGKTLASALPPPPQDKPAEGPEAHEPGISREEERRQQRELAEKEARAKNPNSYDRARGDMERLQKATDPAKAGALGAGTTGTLRALGVNSRTAGVVGAVVDMVFGLLATKAGGKGSANPEISPRAGAAYGPPRTHLDQTDRGTPYEPLPNTRSPYARDNEGLVWTEPQTLQERIAMESAKRGEGEVIMEGPFNDPRYQDAAWVKMGLVRGTADGNKIEIHYMKNTKTGQTQQFKFLSRGEYPAPKENIHR